MSNKKLTSFKFFNKKKYKKGSYANKHIEKKVRAIDGYFNPFGRYTLQDYKNLKATMALGY